MSKLTQAHYECNNFDVACHETGKANSRVLFHIDEFKLEIDGDPKIIKEGRFSKASVFVCP